MIRGRPGRQGSILLLVCILAVVAFIALFSLGFLSKGDIRTSSNMLREALATSLAESIATQIEAQVNAKPWPDRWWFDPDNPAPQPMITFGKSSAFINLSKESLAPSEYDFAGVIKDLPTQLREYRIFVSVTLKDETYNFSWDKRWEMALLTGLNRDTTMMDKGMDEAQPSETSVDQLIDGIKTKIDAAPPPDKSPQAQVTRLHGLRRDERSFKAHAQMDNRNPGAPKLPPLP